MHRLKEHMRKQHPESIIDLIDEHPKSTPPVVTKVKWEPSVVGPPPKIRKQRRKETEVITTPSAIVQPAVASLPFITTPSILSLVQASNGQVYLLQQQQQQSCSPSPLGSQQQLFLSPMPHQTATTMILASPTTGDNSVYLATGASVKQLPTTQQLCSLSSTNSSNGRQVNWIANPRVMVPESDTASYSQLDIDLSKSSMPRRYNNEAEQDIVATALVASKVLTVTKGCAK
jgi:hypothetical protein